MTREEAIEQLKFHGGTHQNFEDPRWEKGFLQTLRPFKGLNEDSFTNLLECLSVLKGDIKDNAFIDKEIISSLWGICHFSKCWGTDPNSILRRSNLLSEEELHQLEDWIDQISFTISFWLDGIEEE